jgi:hypothetical protein
LVLPLQRDNRFNNTLSLFSKVYCTFSVPYLLPRNKHQREFFRARLQQTRLHPAWLLISTSFPSQHYYLPWLLAGNRNIRSMVNRANILREQKYTILGWCLSFSLTPGLVNLSHIVRDIAGMIDWVILGAQASDKVSFVAVQM